MLQAMDAVEDPEFKAKLFDNALEEVHHAALFAKLAQRYADAPLVAPSTKRQRLFDPKKGLAHFEAHHYVGEGEVYEQFLTYAQAAPCKEIADLFLVIRGDEEEHQQLAYRELIKLVGSEDQARALIRRVQWIRFLEAWGRVSAGIGSLVSSFVLTVIYFAVAPFFVWGCRRRVRDLSFQKCSVESHWLRASAANPLSPHRA
jgi:rubrerythrin